MNDWEKAIWMLSEGFTFKELKKLKPEDADSWRRLKVILNNRKGGNESVSSRKKNRDGRAYIVYQCKESDEVRGKTKQDRTKSCGAWNIQVSRRMPTDSPSHQGRCPCGKRSNLSIKNTHCFESREEAYEFVYVMNKTFKAGA